MKPATIAAIALGLAASFWFLRRPAPDETRTDALAAKVAALEAELHAERRASRTRDVVGVLASAPASTNEADLSSSSAATQRMAPRIALNERLANEGRDGAWSGDGERQIARALADAALDGTVVGAPDCRETGCIVELTHDDDNARERAARWLQTHPPFAAGGLLVADGNKTVAHFDREVLER